MTPHPFRIQLFTLIGRLRMSLVHLPGMHPLAAASSRPATTSLVSLLGRLSISLLVVLGVLWGLAQVAGRRSSRLSSRRGRSGRARPKPVDVLTRQSLGKGQALVTVRLDERFLLLGVTAQSITTLCELDGPMVEADEEAPGRERLTERSPLGRFGRLSALATRPAFASIGPAELAVPSAPTPSGQAQTMRGFGQWLEHLRDLTVRT